ncbi:MAG: hypothetical protein LUE11_11980 [Clostridia bacterium]|nr:hypothetical protein [Clostridia bacterium]
MSALIVIFAAIIVLIAVIIICSMIFSSCKKCWIRLYETGMDGKSLISSGTGGRQRFSYQDIQHASIQTIFLVIQVNGVQHKFMSADNQRALQIINSCMQRHYQHIQ